MNETRASGTVAPSNDLKVRGYAVTWEPYTMGPDSWERIDRSAFDAALESPEDVALLWNHDTSKPMARVRAGNLRIFTDEVGLGFEATLPDTAVSRDAVSLIRSGVVSQCSFGFHVRGERYEKAPDGKPLRVITDANLVEISAVTFPANPATSVEARNAQPAARKRYYLPPEM
jgi:HK97 family phage prohead protease